MTDAATGANEQDLVLFDADCPLCRSLAELAGRRTGGALRFAPWQEARAMLGAEEQTRPADKLRVLTGGRLLEGEGAWTFLLEHYEGLAGLGWLAGKLGIAKETARVMAGSAGLLRRMCRRCGKG